MVQARGMGFDRVGGRLDRFEISLLRGARTPFSVYDATYNANGYSGVPRVIADDARNAIQGWVSYKRGAKPISDSEDSSRK